MEAFMIWLGLLAVVFLLIGVAWGYLRLGRRESRAMDERQKLAERTGMTLGFFVAVIYFFVVWVLISEMELTMDTVRILILAGIMLSLLSAEICILLMGAILPLNKIPALTVFVWFLVSVSQLSSSVRMASILEEQFEVSGFIPWERLILSASFFAMGVIHLIGWLMSRKSDE